jgi:hypothetical protein
VRPAILGVALVVFGLLIGSQVSTTAPPAEASFHEVRIYGVMGGKGDTASAQFIELRMASGGQNQMQFAHLCFYDQDGVPWARFVFPSSVPSGASQGSILIASGAMNAEWQAGGAVADFIFSAANTTAINPSADVNAPIPVPAGSIVYEAEAPDCGSPSSIDSIAYGTGYNGVAFFGDPIDQDLPISGSQGFQLTDTPVDFPPTDNAAEYALANCIIARNNAGASGPIGGECVATATPTPSAAPTATPTAPATATPTIPIDTTPAVTPTDDPTPTGTPFRPIQGDTDCNGQIELEDGMLILEERAGVGITCGQGNTNCDEFQDGRDALLVFLYLADLPRAVEDCADVGQVID